MTPLSRLAFKMRNLARPAAKKSQGRGNAAEAKTSAIGKLLGSSIETAFFPTSRPVWTGRSFELLAREGYQKNAVVHRAVKTVSESAAAVQLKLRRGDRCLDSHPLLDLLDRPNPLQSGKALLESVYAYLLLAGNTYLEAAENLTGQPGELYVLRPDRTKIIAGPKGWPLRFEYRVGGHVHRFPVEADTGKSPVLHLKFFNPLDDWYGLSPLEAAAFGIDIHNAASSWNKALLDNAARPSGALVFEPQDGAINSMSDEQFRRLKDELEESYQGARNAGRPFLLEGGLKWQQIAFSPSDMDFINSKHVSAREIALAFGVPPMLLGIPGDNTYSNYQEANRALWRLTLLPLIESVLSSLNSWLAPSFGPDLRLEIDMESVPALQSEREALWTRIGRAAFLTANEKRRLLGYEPIAGGDLLSPFPSSSPPSVSQAKGSGDTHPLGSGKRRVRKSVRRDPGRTTVDVRPAED